MIGVLSRVVVHRGADQNQFAALVHEDPYLVLQVGNPALELFEGRHVSSMQPSADKGPLLFAGDRLSLALGLSRTQH